MKKYFIPKFTQDTEKELGSRITWLEEKFKFLSPANIAEVQYWSNSKSPHGGTIINEGAQYKCYPYNRDKIGFKEEHTEGEVLELNFLPVKLSEVILDLDVRGRVERQMRDNQHIVLLHRHFDGRMLLVVGHYYLTSPNEFRADFVAVDTISDLETLKKEAKRHSLIMPPGYGENRGQWLTLMERSSKITGWKPMETIREFS
jgi:hypothetical protein